MLRRHFGTSNDRIDVLLAYPGSETGLRHAHRNHGDLKFAACFNRARVTSVHRNVAVDIAHEQVDALNQILGVFQIVGDECRSIAIACRDLLVDIGHDLSDEFLDGLHFGAEFIGFK